MAYYCYRKTNAIFVACLCLIFSLSPSDARKGMQHGAAIGMPDHPDAVVNTVKQMSALGQFPQAIKILDDAIQRSSGKAQYYFVRGQLYEFTERLDEAEADYKRAWLSHQLNNREALHMAWELNHFGGVVLCREICDTIVGDKSPVQSGRAYFIRGRLNSQAKKFPEAISDYEHSLKLQPGHSQASFELGRLYLASGRYKDAIAQFDLVLAEAAPKEQVKMIDALRWRAEAYAKMGKNQLAIDDLSRAFKMSPLQVVLLIRRAEIYKTMGLAKEAEADMKLAKKIDEENSF